MSSFGGSNSGFVNPSIGSSGNSEDLLPDVENDEIIFESSDPTADLNINDAVLRVAFSNNADQNSVYTEAYFSIQEGSGGRKVFYGWLRTINGDIANPIEIPLVQGMALIELADMISNIPGIVANVLNGYGLSDVTSLLRSGTFDGTNQWSYFFSNLNIEDINPIGNIDIKPDIKYYLTSVEPNLPQANPSQSLGGFISPTEIETSTTLAREVIFRDMQIQCSDNSLNSYNYIQIQDEIIEVESWSGSTAIVANRNAFDTPLRVHFEGAVVRGLSKNSVFTFGFSTGRKQYRCIAIRNESNNLNAKKAKVYVKILSRNNKSRWNISIEIPRSEYKASSVTGGTLFSVVDSSLAGNFLDNHYVTAPIVFTSGQNSGQFRIVTEYNGATGTFSFDEELPYPLSLGDTYYVDTAPSQRVPSGVTKPQIVPNSNNNVTPPYLIEDFKNTDGFASGISIDVNDQRSTFGERISADLGPKESIYVWVERELDDDNIGQENNRLALTLEFSKV